MSSLADSVSALAHSRGFSGVVRVDRGEHTELAAAFGLAERGYGIPHPMDTQLALASGVKPLTALVVVSLIQEGLLRPDAPVRALLDADLPLIDDAVSVEHLLAHRSGIGDYVDEDSDLDVNDYLMPVPVHRLARTEDYLTVLEGHPQKFPPGERFSYCNSGYVVLALLAERASGQDFPALVQRRVCEPARMVDTTFLRSDELPARAARGYLHADGLRTNVLHLPVRGSGDGGIYTTAADVHALWQALDHARVVSREWYAEMTRPRSEAPAESARYGLGFWLPLPGDRVAFEGMDAGVSCRSVHHAWSGVTHTVLANTSGGAWALSRHLDEQLLGA